MQRKIRERGGENRSMRRRAGGRKVLFQVRKLRTISADWRELPNSYQLENLPWGTHIHPVTPDIYLVISI
jgi:hypothetical protein